MTGVTKSDLLLSTSAAPKTEKSFAVEAFKKRGERRQEQTNGSLLSRMMTAFRRARARRATIDQLSQLSDQTLRDIGLEPGTLVETVDATMERRQPSYRQDDHGALSQVGQAMRSVFARLDELQRLNDRLLADIGVDRADLESQIVDQRVAAANHNRALFRAA